jgi:hypothetical protein
MKTHNGTRVNADICGNPRYVWHFLDFLTDADRERVRNEVRHPIYALGREKEIAIEKARKIGGKAYHGRDFGGGIVFTTYAPDDIQKRIDELKNS